MPTKHTPSDRDTSMVPPEADDTTRRPGEVVFTGFLLIFSLVLLWSAFDIAGFSKLSSPGAIPLATTATMVVTSAIILFRTLRLPKLSGQTLAHDILPPVVIVLALMLLGFGLFLKPLGFLPTAAIFLIGAIKYLSGRSWRFAIGVALGTLALIWVVFRVVFTVLMPQGIVPEAEFMQILRDLFSGGNS